MILVELVFHNLIITRNQIISFQEMLLIGACLSKVLLMKCKKVSNPRFVWLSSVTNDQSNSHRHWSCRCWLCSINAGIRSFFRHIFFIFLFLIHLLFTTRILQVFTLLYVRFLQILCSVLCLLLTSVKLWPHATIIEWQKK